MTGDERHDRRRPGRRCWRSTRRSSACSRRVAAPGAEQAETVSTFDALGRVLAADVRSQHRRAAGGQQRDGRLRAARRRRRRRPARVLPCQPAHRRPAASARRSQPGTAARIFTGAQVRRGADAVVMQEQCTRRRRRRAHRRRAAQPASGSAAAARTSRAARVVLGARHPPDAAGARAWRRRSARRRCRSRAGRASRCSRPATSWRCRASR